MHQLTIDHDSKSISITDHPNFGDAHRALLQYVVGADYYLRPVQNTVVHTSYELLRLADLDSPARARDPHITGIATIEEVPAAELPVSAPYFTACEAQRWISDHAATWLDGSANDPGYHYPMAVLTMARGEARCYLRAGTLLPEAADLAGVQGVAHPDQASVEALRHNAIADASHPGNPAAMADAVQRQLPAGATAGQTAALIWYYALIVWGVNAP